MREYLTIVAGGMAIGPGELMRHSEVKLFNGLKLTRNAQPGSVVGEAIGRNGDGHVDCFFPAAVASATFLEPDCTGAVGQTCRCSV